MTIKNLRKKKVSAILVAMTFLMTSMGMSPASANYNGEQGNKVEICHEGHTIEVAESAVQAHMAHGDTLGACVGNPTDTVAPVISSHADVYMEATLSSGISVNYSLPGATDNHDASVVVSCSPVSGTVFAVGTTTVTCTATDSAGNTATSTFHIIVTLATDNGGGNGTTTDVTAPVISAHSDVSVTASTSAGINVTYSLPTATDNVDSSVSVTCLPMSGSLFPIGTSTVTCTATDHAGNTATSTFHVIVTLATGGGGNGTSTDMTAPVFAVHPDVYASASTSAGVIVSYTNATATDNVDASLIVLCSPLSGTVFPVGTTTVTCTTSDTAGNMASTTFQVIVTLNSSGGGGDTIAPIFAVHPDVNATTSTSTGAIVNYVNATATDNVDTSLTVVCSPSSGSLFPLGTTTVSCSTMDNASNTATTSFHVIVVLVSGSTTGTTTGTTTENTNGTTTGTTTGSTIPVISIGGQSCAATTTVTITGTAATGTVVTLLGGTGSFMATTSAAGTWSATVSLSGASSSNPFDITIRDANGNVVSTSTTNVSFDSVAPVITLNGDASMTVFDSNGFTDPGVIVTDNLGGNITASTTGRVDIHTPGTYTLTYSAVDCAGNVITATRTVTVLAASGGGGGGGGGGTTNTGGTGNTATSPGVTGGALFTTLPLGLGGIGGNSAFLPASTAFLPTLALVPGIPSTGMGGSASQNIAILLSTLGLVALGIALQRKKKVM